MRFSASFFAAKNRQTSLGDTLVFARGENNHCSDATCRENGAGLSSSLFRNIFAYPMSMSYPDSDIGVKRLPKKTLIHELGDSSRSRGTSEK